MHRKIYVSILRIPDYTLIISMSSDYFPKKPLISVAVATYNGSRFLRQQLDSIYAQTWSNFEVVVCDDCSKDNTPNILEEYRQRYGLRYEVNERNLGLIRNFEKVLLSCRGEFIVLSDQDDVWRPVKLEKIVSIFNTMPEIGYVFSDAELVDDNLCSLGCTMWNSVGFQGNIRQVFSCGNQLVSLLRQRFVTGATMALKRSLLPVLLPFPVGTIWLHDGWIAIVATSLGCYGMPVEETLIMYRQHVAQQVGAPIQNKVSMLERYNNFRSNRDRNAAKYEKMAQSYEYLYKHILAVEPKKGMVSSEVLKDLQEASIHFYRRSVINKSNSLKKYSLLIKEVPTGRYRRYSNSFKSILTDIL